MKCVAISPADARYAIQCSVASNIMDTDSITQNIHKDAFMLRNFVWPAEWYIAQKLMSRNR